MTPIAGCLSARYKPQDRHHVDRRQPRRFLQAASDPGKLLQAEDRCHRIGQHQQVTVYFLLAAQTIDEDMAHLIDKREVLNSILDGKANATPAILTSSSISIKHGGHHGPTKAATLSDKNGQPG